MSGDIDDALNRAHAARERSRAAHEAAKNTHRRAADLHYRAAHFQEEHAAAERELGHAGKPRRWKQPRGEPATGRVPNTCGRSSSERLTPTRSSVSRSR